MENPTLNPLAQALADQCRLDVGALTASELGRLRRAARELREVGATVDEVARRGSRYRVMWPDRLITPSAIASNWQLLHDAAGERARHRPSPDDLGRRWADVVTAGTYSPGDAREALLAEARLTFDDDRSEQALAAFAAALALAEGVTA